MGCFDSVMVPCPKCGEKAEFQSKGGDCLMAYYELGKAPIGVMMDVNRHSPAECGKCHTKFGVGIRGNAYTSMTEEEMESSAAKVTNRDSMAAMMRSAITGAVLDVAQRFGLGEDFEPVAEALEEEAVKAIYEISAEEFDKKCEVYRVEMERLMEEGKKRQEEFLKELEQLKKKKESNPEPKGGSA